MIKRGLLQKLLLVSFLFTCTGLQAQQLPDSVVMVIAGKPVSMAEFLFMAQKNDEVELSDSNSVNQYIELFKNFKLKVADAEASGLARSQSFRNELDTYRAQLTSSFLSDKAGENAAVQDVYNRYSEMLELSHILFKMPKPSVTQDTVAAYALADEAYRRINNGESFEAVGQALATANPDLIRYEYVHCLLPMQTVKAFEYAAYDMPVGTVSAPVRTTLGFHLIKLHNRKPNPGMRTAAHILIPVASDSIPDADQTALNKANEVYKQAVNQGDFSILAQTYSSDAATAGRGGVLPEFGAGEMVESFETAAFALQNPGDISEPVKSPFGYHIIKLLDKRGIPDFEEKKSKWARIMAQGERNFEYNQTFDDRMKQEYGFRFYPEAYRELQNLCDVYYPANPAFYTDMPQMQAVLFHVNDTDYTQRDFLSYMQRHPYSTKSYSGDFMEDVFKLYVRELLIQAEKANLSVKYPEYNHLMREYHDGILLFEISNKKIWNQPAEQQSELEAAWIQQLNEKYPVEINWEILKKVNK